MITETASSLHSYYIHVFLLDIPIYLFIIIIIHKRFAAEKRSAFALLSADCPPLAWYNHGSSNPILFKELTIIGAESL